MACSNLLAKRALQSRRRKLPLRHPSPTARASHLPVMHVPPALQASAASPQHDLPSVPVISGRAVLPRVPRRQAVCAIMAGLVLCLRLARRVVRRVRHPCQPRLRWVFAHPTLPTCRLWARASQAALAYRRPHPGFSLRLHHPSPRRVTTIPRTSVSQRYLRSRTHPDLRHARTRRAGSSAPRFLVL